MTLGAAEDADVGSPDQTGSDHPGGWTTRRPEPAPARPESLRDAIPIAGFALGVAAIGRDDRPSFTGRRVELDARSYARRQKRREPRLPLTHDEQESWARALCDTLRTLPEVRRASILGAETDDPLACPVVLILVDPFDEWPRVVREVRKVHDDLGQRTECVLVGDDDLRRAFAEGLYALSAGVTIDWSTLPGEPRDAFVGVWDEPLWEP